VELPSGEIGAFDGPKGRWAKRGQATASSQPGWHSSGRFTTGDQVADRQIVVDQGKKLNADRDALARAYPVVSQLDRFEGLNKAQRTGGIQHQDPDGWGQVNPLSWPGTVGKWFADQDPEIKEMSGIASGLQGQARPAGSGATSDFEQRLYRQGVPAPDKRGKTNQNIIRYQKGVIAEEDDRLAFQEEFMRRNGSLNGSQAQWGRYLAKNPYTVVDKGGATKPNSGRADWKEHFGLQAPRAAAPKAAAAPRWTKKQQAVASLLKPTGPVGLEKNPILINPNDPHASYDRVDSGQWYITPKGERLQKKAR